MEESQPRAQTAHFAIFAENFQNELDHAASSFLLTAVDPVAVFSGNDHDYCEVTHHLAMSSPKEVSCKTFSTAVGIRKPGYQLVTLLNPLQARSSQSLTKSGTHQSRLCLLPDPGAIYSRICTSFPPCRMLQLISGCRRSAPCSAHAFGAGSAEALAECSYPTRHNGSLKWAVYADQLNIEIDPASLVRQASR